MKKIISLILAVLLCLGAFPLTVFADTEPEPAIEWELPSLAEGVRLVSIGDSTSNGYFLEGYVDNYQGMGSNAGTNCYPMKLYRDMVEIYGEDNVIFSQYCLNSMRWNELRILLERAFAGEEFVGDDLCYLDNFNRLNNPDSNTYVNSFDSAKNNGIAHIGDPAVLDGGLYATFADSIKNADIITIDLGMNNFGTYVCQRLMANIGMKPAIGTGTYSENLLDIRDQLKAAYGDAVIGKIRAIEANMLSQIGDYDSWAKLALQNNGATVLDLLNTVDSILDAATAKVTLDQMATALDSSKHDAWMLFDVIETVTYSFGCVLLHYDKSMEYIYAANPDAMVIIDGLYNSMDGMIAKMDETTSFQFGEVWGTLLSNVSGFLSGEDETYAKNRWIDKIRYGNVNPKLSIILDEIKNFDTTFVGKNPLIDYKNNVDLKNSVDRIIDMVYKLNDNMEKPEDLTPAISAALLKGIHDVTEENVKNGIPEEYAGVVDADDIAAYVADKVVEGVKKNCCADKKQVSASDVKKAYQNNKISKFEFDISSLSLLELALIVKEDYSPLDDLCLDPVNSNFAVSAGFEVIRKNIVKAAALTTINLGDVFQAFGPKTDLAAVVAPALADYDKADETAKALLHICVRFVGLRGVGTHPDAIGAEAKYQAVKAQMPELKPVLTIHYVDANGENLADDYTAKVVYNSSYSVDSPAITGYTPDKATVSGTMGATPVEETVIYTPNNYALTINYVDGEEKALADAYVDANVPYNSEYSVDSPSVIGYTTQDVTISGTMDAEGKEINVVYTPNQYDLTIHYKYEDDTEAHADHTAKVTYNSEYSVDSPAITGYTADKPTVSGTMGATPVEETVTYTPNNYALTIKYVDNKGKELAAAHEETLAFGSSYDVPSPTITGYTTQDVTISGTMDAEGKEINVVYTPNQYDLTIHYQYEGGTEAHADHTAKVAYNSEYSVDSPAITGYTPNKATVSGTMGATPVDVTVTYTLNQYNLAIHYNYENGTEANADYTETVAFGEDYSVNSPAITGYTADKLTVSGTMGAGNEEINVVYTPNQYDLTIHYQYGDRTKADEDYTSSVTFGETYEVDSPAITGYTADFATVSGTMDTEGKEIIVTYAPNQYNLKIVYLKQDGSKAYPDYTADLSYDQPYSIPSPEVKGYSPDIATVSGTVGLEGIEKTVTYTPNDYTLTVHYVYANGTEAASDYTGEVTFGETYNVTSPAITGYTPNQATVSGTMDEEGKKITVTYAPNKYTLTIHYQDADGETLATDHTSEVTYAETYSVTSPEITGYTADKPTVSGTMGATPIDETVTYTPNEYGLTIHYVYEGGTQVRDDYTAKVKFNGTYSVDSPAITGYTPDKATVSGKMGSTDAEITVYYVVNKHSLTVHYVFEDETKAANDHTEQVVEGADYSVPSPTVTGYTPNQVAVSGKMGTEDVDVTVCYAVNKHSLTIHYQYSSGSKAANDHTEQIAEGADYSVPSPAIAWYMPNKATISGKMGTEDVVETVIYSESEEFKAAKAVDALIGEISSTVTKDDEEDIKAARAAYNALTADQKKLVKELETLLDAEAALAELNENISVDVKPEVEEGSASVTIDETTVIVEEKPVVITATTKEETAETVLTIPAAVAEKLGSAQSLEIATDSGTVSFDNDALQQIFGNDAGEVTLSMAKEADNEGNIVIELTALDKDGNNLFDGTGEGSATVEVPAAEPEEGKEYHAYFKDGDTLIPIDCEYVNGKLVLVLEHFSEYVVKMEDAELDDEIEVKHSLVLSGQIGVNFKMTLPEEKRPSGSYMEFKVSGKDGETTRVNLSDATKLEDGRYQFTCYVNSIQMADTITATYHYGTETYQETYSVKEYIETLVANAESFDSKTVALGKAIADYGYYAQKALSQQNGFTVGAGKDHEEMIHYNNAPNTNINLSQYTHTVTGVPSTITKVTRSLLLDSKTSIRIYCTVTDRFTVPSSVTIDNVRTNMVKEADGRYTVTIPSISAHLLGTNYVVKIGNMTVTTSALAYVKEMLASASFSADMKNAAAALYQYYDATMDYRVAHPTAVQ